MNWISQFRPGFDRLAIAVVAVTTAHAQAQEEPLAIWDFENGSFDPIAPNPFIEASAATRFVDDSLLLPVPWPNDAILPGSGEFGSGGLNLGEGVFTAVTVTNVHETEPFQLAQFRFSFFTKGDLSFLFRPPGTDFFLEIDDSLLSGGVFAQFLFPLADFGPDSELSPGESVAFAMFGLGSDARLDNLVLDGSGPDPPPLGPPATTLEPISKIESLESSTRLEMPVAFRRNVGVEYSTDGAEGSWIELGNFFEEDGVAVFIDTDPTRHARARGFYRAFLRPLPEE